MCRSLGLLLMLLATASAVPRAPIPRWQPLQSGVELAIIPTVVQRSEVADVICHEYSSLTCCFAQLGLVIRAAQPRVIGRNNVSAVLTKSPDKSGRLAILVELETETVHA